MAKPQPAGIQVLGLNALVRDLRKMQSKEFLNDLRGAHKNASERAAAAARSEAPVRSGRLATSIKPKATNREGRIKAGTGKRVPYAGPIHFGWKERGIEANQFMYRGIRKALPDIKKDYEDEVTRIAANYGRRFPTKI